MPEIVEVEIQKEGLSKLVGETIKSVSFHDKGEKIIRPLSLEVFESQVSNKQITGVYRRGKYIVIDLNNEILLTSHLAMTGRWLLDVPEETLGHSRLTFYLASGKILRYSDVRVFGRIRLESDLSNKIYKKGLDTLTATSYQVGEQLLVIKKDFSVKKLLTDQKVLCGLGNVYANEVLWRSKLHPNTNIKSLDKTNIFKLAQTIKDVLKEGYRNGGLSLKDYYHVDGSQGQAQLYLNVYRQQSCKDCGSTIQKSDLYDGKSTYYCPKCQR